MEYRAVGNRCAVNMDSLNVPLSRKDILTILIHEGFIMTPIDIMALARGCVGASQYRRGARPSEAPSVVDCSSFIKWLFGMRGIWLPRRTIQQCKLGEVVSFYNIVDGDVVFVSGRINYYEHNSDGGVGHVGIAAEGGKTIIHASAKDAVVAEVPFSEFVDKNTFRGARRYISKNPNNTSIMTFETPVSREVETSDDIRWIVLESELFCKFEKFKNKKMKK
ncbi:MAG: C40 family peptidase [Parcubacteria group bacterium]|nr:C40 family peptidase [Parcubacteria group bacterium]